MWEERVAEDIYIASELIANASEAIYRVVLVLTAEVEKEIQAGNEKMVLARLVQQRLFTNAQAHLAETMTLLQEGTNALRGTVGK